MPKCLALAAAEHGYKAGIYRVLVDAGPGAQKGIREYANTTSDGATSSCFMHAALDSIPKMHRHIENGKATKFSVTKAISHFTLLAQFPGRMLHFMWKLLRRKWVKQYKQKSIR